MHPLGPVWNLKAIASIASRWSRQRPPRLGVRFGSNGSIRAHCASVIDVRRQMIRRSERNGLNHADSRTAYRVTLQTSRDRVTTAEPAVIE